MSVPPPRVFISYSHDSSAHKQWVLEFASTLRNRGVDAVLDQWDLKPGDDLPEFMEKNLSMADCAIMVCTKRYVEKANAGQGGVGYEKMIMTSSSLSKISNSNVIPIIREFGEPATPTFLQTKLYIDFSEDSDVEFALDELLRLLLDAPLYEKPKIGKDPLQPLENSRPDKTADGVRDVMKSIADAYDSSTKDYIYFSTLVKSSSMRRLTLDKYLVEAESMELITNNWTAVCITEKGAQYLTENGIVDA